MTLISVASVRTHQTIYIVKIKVEQNRKMRLQILDTYGSKILDESVVTQKNFFVCPFL